MKNDATLRILYSFKLAEDFRVADYLARQMSERIVKDFEGIKFDAITAVPTKALKKFEKGYNHSEVLARKISKSIGVPYKETLKYVGKGKSQHTLSRNDRFENVRGLYSARKIENIKTILLIDDIKTTGASLNECAKELMFAGVEDVYCAVAIVNGKSS